MEAITLRLKLSLEDGITIRGWTIKVFRCTGCGNVYHIEIRNDSGKTCIPF